MKSIKNPLQHLVRPDQPIRLGDYSSRAKDHFSGSRDEAEEEFKALRKELAELQFRLYAEDRQQLLIVLQAMDAGGKDGTIRKVFRGTNPQGVEVTSFKAPTKEELAHDFLWRIHKATPAKGKIGIFNRSHYEDVLIVRVLNLVDESVWRPRYETINNFEKSLADSGTKILKFYLHISKDEQKERLQARLDDPTRNWKFDAGDLEQRKHWESYMEAFEAVLNSCSTDYAGWYVIPADQKWYRNLAISRVIINTLRDMNPQFPPAAEGLDQIVIE